MERQDTDVSSLVLESKVDWLTLTSSRAGRFAEMLEFGYKQVVNQANGGNIPKPFHWQGYQGAHCGAITYGDRQDGAILQISGAEAHRLFSETLPLEPKCTRIDVQVTVRLADSSTRWAARSYRELTNLPLVRGTRPTATYYANTEGGETCYLGAPTSEHRGRIYDKGAESGKPEYRNCYRWEVETRAERGQKLYRLLAESRTLSESIAGYVAEWFAARGCDLPFSAETRLTLSPATPDKSDVGRKLQWLKEQVRPSVEYLCLSGYSQECISALGLTSGILPENQRTDHVSAVRVS